MDSPVDFEQIDTNNLSKIWNGWNAFKGNFFL